MSISKNIKADGQTFAKFCKFLLNNKDPYVLYKRDFQHTQSKSFYIKDKDLFDKLAAILQKNNIDYQLFADFCINKLNATKFNIIDILKNPQTMKSYFDSLYKIEKNKYIYKLFQKSIKNIIKDCIKLGYNNATDYLRFLISKKLLASYFASGKISIYYLAAIPNFKKTIEKLDDMSKDEFKTLYERFDVYHEDMNQALVYVKNIRLNPLKYTNEILLKLRSKKV